MTKFLIARTRDEAGGFIAKTLFFGLGGLMLIGVVGSASSSSDSSSAGSSAGGSAGSSSSSFSSSPAMAFEMCKDSVKNKLKAPSTATFRNFYQKDGEVVVSGSAGSYRIVSTVDAQNSFGAKIRSSFSCLASYKGADRWSVSSTLID